jgi:hypothetical protein
VREGVNQVTFEEFVEIFVQGEIIQESGRLRAHLRPEEQLVYYFIGDYNLEFLSQALPGSTLDIKAAVELSPKAGTKNQRAIWLVARFFTSVFTQDKELTQQEISLQASKKEEKGISQGRISQIGKQFGGWAIFSKLISELLSSFLATTTSNECEFHEDERWILDVYLPLLVYTGEIQPVEAIKQVVELISVYGWQNFRKIIDSVALDVKSVLLEYLLSMIPPEIFSAFLAIIHGFSEDSSRRIFFISRSKARYIARF